VDGIFKVVSPKYLRWLIDNSYLLIESTFYAIRHPPQEFYDTADPEEARKVERVRVMGEKIGLPLFGMLRYVCAQFPYEAVEGKVTPEWVRKRGKLKFPELVKVWEDTGEAGEKWLKAQCREVILFATGRLLWSDQAMRMVAVRPAVRR